MHDVTPLVEALDDSAAKQHFSHLSTRLWRSQFGYRENLLALIDEKAKALPPPASEPQEPANPGVPDLMAALKQAVEEAHKKAEKPAKRAKAAARA